MTATGPPGSRTGRYAEIVHEATLMFGDVGYERATVRMLADRLGIKSGSLYSHISSKEEVLYWVILDVADEFTACGRQAVDEAGTAEDQVRALCRSHMGVIQEKRLKVRVYFEEWRKLEAEHQEKIIRLRDDYESLLASVIAAGEASGEFSGDPRLTARVLLSALNSTAGWYSEHGPMSSDDVADSILDVFLQGMLPR